MFYRKKKLSILLKELRGKRSFRHVSNQTGLSASYIRLLEVDDSVTPSLETLKILGDYYKKDVTYEQLMMAAGHINEGLVVEPKTLEIRYKTIEESNVENEESQKVLENDIRKLLFNNKYVNYDGQILSSFVKVKIVESINQLLQKEMEYMMMLNEDEDSLMDIIEDDYRKELMAQLDEL